MTDATADQNPMMSDDFARVYEASAHRITGPISVAALAMAGGVRPSMRVLDIAAGAGALSVPAAQWGAEVVALDIAPGMVSRLRAVLAPFPGCEAVCGDGAALHFADGAFDLTFSIFGAILFPDWRAGLREQARVLRKGGKGCVATWRQPPGGGPFVIMAEAMRRCFPDLAPPPPPEGMAVLSDPIRLRHEMEAAGFDDVEVREVDAVWSAPAGDGYLDDAQELYRYMPAYEHLDVGERARLNNTIRELVDGRAKDGVVGLSSPVLMATGLRAI